MFVILSYDIGRKRVGKALKICRKYLTHRHKSVFEGNVSEAKLTRLKRELERILDVSHDAVCIYRIDNPRFVLRDEIGVIRDGGEII